MKGSQCFETLKPSSTRLQARGAPADEHRVPPGPTLRRPAGRSLPRASTLGITRYVAVVQNIEVQLVEDPAGRGDVGVQFVEGMGRSLDRYPPSTAEAFSSSRSRSSVPTHASFSTSRREGSEPGLVPPCLGITASSVAFAVPITPLAHALPASFIVARRHRDLVPSSYKTCATSSAAPLSSTRYRYTSRPWRPSDQRASPAAHLHADVSENVGAGAHPTTEAAEVFGTFKRDLVSLSSLLHRLL